MGPRTVNRAWCAGLNRHDPTAVAACFSADCVLIDHGTGRRHIGRTAVLRATAHWLASVADLHIEELTFLCSDVQFAKEWTMSGVHVGDLFGLPASGLSFAVHGAGLGEIHDGEIVSAALYWNAADVSAQLDRCEWGDGLTAGAAPSAAAGTALLRPDATALLPADADA